MLETSGDFHGVGGFFGGIFTMLETSSGIFTMLETSSVDFLGGIFNVLETSSGDFHGAETFGIFTVLGTSLEGFSRCWRLPWRDFHGARDFFWRFSQFWRLLGFSWCWRLFLEIFVVLETSLDSYSRDFHGAGDRAGKNHGAREHAAFLNFVLFSLARSRRHTKILLSPHFSSPYLRLLGGAFIKKGTRKKGIFFHLWLETSSEIFSV